MENKDTKNNTLTKYLGYILGFTLVGALAYYSFKAGYDYSERVEKEINNTIEKMKININENKEVYCNNMIISKTNGWSVYHNEKNNFFVREDKYIDISECAVENLPKVPLIEF